MCKSLQNSARNIVPNKHEIRSYSLNRKSLSVCLVPDPQQYATASPQLSPDPRLAQFGRNTPVCGM